MSPRPRMSAREVERKHNSEEYLGTPETSEPEALEVEDITGSDYRHKFQEAEAELERERKHRLELEKGLSSGSKQAYVVRDAKIKNWPCYSYMAKDLQGRPVKEVQVCIDYDKPVYWLEGGEYKNGQFIPINGLVRVKAKDNLQHFINFENGIAVTNDREDADYLFLNGIVQGIHPLV